MGAAVSDAMPDGAFWIEVLSRHHRDVAQRHRVAGGAATLGRAYDNDVVLDDPFVAPRHLRVLRDAEGRLFAEDLGSANGIAREGSRRRERLIPLDGETAIRVGHTLVRVRDASHPVAPERVARPLAHTWPAAIALLVALVAMEGAFLWLRDFGEPRASRYLAQLLPATLVLAVWSTGWSILARIFSGQARFDLHLLIAILALGAYSLANEVTSLIGFAWAWRLPQNNEYVLVWLIVALACFAHLRVIGPARLGLKAGVVALIAALGLAGQTVTRLDGGPLLDRPPPAGQALLPPNFRLTDLRAPDRFLADIDKLRRRLDGDRRKDPGEEFGLFQDDDD